MIIIENSTKVAKIVEKYVILQMQICEDISSKECKTEDYRFVGAIGGVGLIGVEQSVNKNEALLESRASYIRIILKFKKKSFHYQ